MTLRTTAPADLPLPEYVVPQLCDRQHRVLDHGFTADVIGTKWWSDRLAGTNQHVQTFDHNGDQRLTRSDLFELGRAASAPNASDDAVLKLLWNTLAWGTGKSQRGNAARMHAFANADDRERHVDLLRTAAMHAAAGDARTAYSTLIKSGGGKIPRLGPAFFTKFLYFASEDVPAAGTRCLILDARVAESLSNAGWSDMPQIRGKFSYNWYTDTYISYCEILKCWADEVSANTGTKIHPDEIEKALFEGK